MEVLEKVVLIKAEAVSLVAEEAAAGTEVALDLMELLALVDQVMSTLLPLLQIILLDVY